MEKEKEKKKKKKKAQNILPQSIHFEFCEGILSGMIRVAMAPQVTILWGFGDHYTKNILAIVDVALATTRNLNIKLEIWKNPKKFCPPRVYIFKKSLEY